MSVPSRSGDESEKDTQYQTSAQPNDSQVFAGGVGRAMESGISGQRVTVQGVLAAIGGWIGVVESLLPPLTFLLGYVFTRDAKLAVIAPLALAGVALVWRLLRRQALTAALSGLFGVVVCAAAVVFSGEGSSFFVPGFVLNAVWLLAHLVSLLVGWPLLGLLLGVLTGSQREWRENPVLRRAVHLTSYAWIGLFASRLAVQLPLYFSAPPFGDSESAIEALGLARLLMGVPLFALAVLFTWLVLSRVSSAVAGSERNSSPTRTPTSDE